MTPSPDSLNHSLLVNRIAAPKDHERPFRENGTPIPPPAGYRLLTEFEPICVGDKWYSSTWQMWRDNKKIGEDELWTPCNFQPFARKIEPQEP